MKKESNSEISFFQRYLTVWVIVCMLIGIMLGHFLPGMKEALNHLEYAGISVAMGNAMEEVKKHAKIVIDNNNNDGVGKFLTDILTEIR